MKYITLLAALAGCFHGVTPDGRREARRLNAVVAIAGAVLVTVGEVAWHQADNNRDGDPAELVWPLIFIGTGAGLAAGGGLGLLGGE
jgi:hypothetical protein